MNIIKPHSKLLKFVSTVVIPATTGKFVAKEKFSRRAYNTAEIRIGAICDNFITWFLSDSGKIEGPIGKQTLCYAELRKCSRNKPIIFELGGEEKAETTLTEMSYLMEKQKAFDEYVDIDDYLLIDGCANIFYVRDQNGVLRAVSVSLYILLNSLWSVKAYPIENPDSWYDENRVFSRQ